MNDRGVLLALTITTSGVKVTVARGGVAVMSVSVTGD